MCNTAGLHQAVNVFKSVLCKCMRYDCSITCTSRTHSCSVIDLPLCALRFLLLQYGGDPFEKQRRDSCSCMTNGRHATEQSASGAPEKNDVTHNMFYNAQQTFDYQYTEQCMRSFSNRVLLRSDSLQLMHLYYTSSVILTQNKNSVHAVFARKKHTRALHNCIQRIEYIEFTHGVAHAMGKALV